MKIGSIHDDPKEQGQAQWFLVWGGATNTGYFTIQLAKLYGHRVIAVCSSHNFDYVREAGAEVVLDRKDSHASLTSQIRQITAGNLRYAFDAVGSTSATSCLRCLESQEPSNERRVLVALAGFPAEVKKAGKVNGVYKLSDGSQVEVPEIKVKVFHNEPDFGDQILKEITAYSS